MRATWTSIGVVLAAAAVAVPTGATASANAKPKVISATVVDDSAAAEREVSILIVGRDVDDVVRGAEIRWGEGQPAQGLSACRLSSRGGSDERRRGKKARFELSYTYPAAGDYTITMRVLSGGCGKRRLQRSAPRTLRVHVE
jgi:hypothetical protein